MTMVTFGRMTNTEAPHPVRPEDVEYYNRHGQIIGVREGQPYYDAARIWAECVEEKRMPDEYPDSPECKEDLDRWLTFFMPKLPLDEIRPYFSSEEIWDFLRFRDDKGTPLPYSRMAMEPRSLMDLPQGRAFTRMWAWHTYVIDTFVMAHRCNKRYGELLHPNGFDHKYGTWDRVNARCLFIGVARAATTAHVLGAWVAWRGNSGIYTFWDVYKEREQSCAYNVRWNMNSPIRRPK